MIPYARQDISQADIEAVIEVLRSEWLTQGPAVSRFEKAVADYCGVAHGVAVNSGTSALHIACMALDLGPGDWLWTSPNSFVASANCGLYCGAKVDFVDIDPRTYNMNVEALTAKLEQAERQGKVPKIVIPVHFAGQPCDTPAIHALSCRYGFRIIEDASHALGARYGEIRVGSCTHSDITVFSFHPVKIITTAEGGMAVTNAPELADRLQRHRSHGITSDPANMQPRPADEIWNYQQIDLGFNYRMTDIQAALGLSQLTRLDEFVARRHAIAQCYDSALSGLPLRTPWQDPVNHSSYHLYPIRLNLDHLDNSQRRVLQKLHAAEIRVNLHYIPIYRQPNYDAMVFPAGYCAEAERHHREVVSIPMYPGLSEEQQNQVISALREVLK